MDIPLDVLRDRLGAWLDDPCWGMVVELCRGKIAEALRGAVTAPDMDTVRKHQGAYVALTWVVEEIPRILKDEVEGESDADGESGREAPHAP